MPKFNESKYRKAVQHLAEQLVLMVQEDYPEGGDDEARQMAADDYAAETIRELQTQIKAML